jgi:hypothetical protein
MVRWLEIKKRAVRDFEFVVPDVLFLFDRRELRWRWLQVPRAERSQEVF